MQQKSVSQATRNDEREAPQRCQDFFTKSGEQSRMIDASYPISAPDGRYEERPSDADPADFDVQQRPGVLDVQAVRISGKSILPETHWSGHLSLHSSKAAYGPSASRVVEGNGASSSTVRLHEDQVGLASPAQHVRPVARDAREAREAEGVTYTQDRHARDNESVESFGTAARQAMLEGHVMPKNIDVPLQLAFHVSVNDDPHSQACAGACEVGRIHRRHLPPAPFMILPARPKT